MYLLIRLISILITSFIFGFFILKALSLLQILISPTIIIGVMIIGTVIFLALNLKPSPSGGGDKPPSGGDKPPSGGDKPPSGGGDKCTPKCGVNCGQDDTCGKKCSNSTIYNYIGTWNINSPGRSQGSVFQYKNLKIQPTSTSNEFNVLDGNTILLNIITPINKEDNITYKNFLSYSPGELKFDANTNVYKSTTLDMFLYPSICTCSNEECSNKECGLDNCGNSCGTCPYPKTCVDIKCV